MASLRSLMSRVLEREAGAGVKYVSAVHPARAEVVVASIYGEGRNDYATCRSDDVALPVT